MNYNKLKGIIVEKRITQTALSRKLNMSVQGFNSKLNGKGSFSVEDAEQLAIILELDNPVEIFFDKLSSKYNEKNS